MEELVPEVVLPMVAEAPDGVVIIDREGVIRYWNRRAERVFGFRVGDDRLNFERDRLREAAATALGPLSSR